MDHANRFKILSARLQHAFGHAPVRQFGYAAAIHVQLLPGPLRHYRRAPAQGRSVVP